MPDGWQPMMLGDACADGGTVQTGPFGSQLHAEDYVPEGVPVVMPVNIGDGRIEARGIARVDEADAMRLARHRLKAGDIVYSRRGDITRRGLVRREEAGWLCGTGCLLVRAGRGVDPSWLSYWLATPWVHDWLRGHAVGATMPNLNTSILSALPVELPPLEAQRRIAGVLGALDDLIDTNQKISVDLERLLAARFTLAGFDEPSNDGHRLADLISINPPYRKPRTDAPYIDMAALPTDRARVASVVQRAPSGGARFQNGDTVMARITPCLENGKTAYIDLLGPDEVGIGSTEFIVLRSAGPLGPHWSYFLARSPRFRESAVQHMSGTSGRQRCPADAIERYSIAMPDHLAASSFAELAEVLFEAIRTLDDEAHQAAHARDELLPLLLSGRVRVEDVAA